MSITQFKVIEVETHIYIRIHLFLFGIMTEGEEKGEILFKISFFFLTRYLAAKKLFCYDIV